MGIIDTGFDGFLTLPPELIQELQLDFVAQRPYSLFGGITVPFDVHLAVVVFAEEERGVVVLSSDNPPLIGMSLLYGFDLFAEVVDGGRVNVTRRPDESIGVDSKDLE